MFTSSGRVWETKRFPNGIRSRNSFPTRKTASFKGYRWNLSVYSSVSTSRNPDFDLGCRQSRHHLSKMRAFFRTLQPGACTHYVRTLTRLRSKKTDVHAASFFQLDFFPSSRGRNSARLLYYTRMSSFSKSKPDFLWKSGFCF